MFILIFYLCAHIEKLWINTKTVEEDEKVKYDNEMKQILRKFKSIKSLHFNEPINNKTINSEQNFNKTQQISISNQYIMNYISQTYLN